MSQKIEFLTEGVIVLIPFFCVTVFTYMDNRGIQLRKNRIRLLFSLGVLFILSTYLNTYLSLFAGDRDASGIWIKLRFFTSNLDYILRPVLLSLLAADIMNWTKSPERLLFLPGLICIPYYLVNWIHPFTFRFNTNNVIVGVSAPMISRNITMFYFFLLWLQVPIFWKRRNIHERLNNLVLLLLISLGFWVDYIGEGNMGTAAFGVALLFYYLMDVLRFATERIYHQKVELQTQKQAMMISQIQPHFLYNTLNVIYSLCTSDPEKAADTILKFSDYLRTNLNFSVQEDLRIPIEEELKHTRTYTDIEQVRYRNIKIVYEVEDGGYQIPPLTVQPIVENAIRHGIRGKKDGCVRIRLYQADKQHYVVIEDNGIGECRGNSLASTTGIGISNVRERIEVIVKGTFCMDMVPGKGTTVTFTIPV